MKTGTFIPKAIHAAIILLAGTCGAKTIALWPLDNRPAGEINPRCLVAGVNNLSGPQGHLPTNEQFAATIPNPDSSSGLFDNPTHNTGSARMLNRYLYNNGFGWQVDLTNSFTVEGWYRISGLPAAQPDFDYLVGPRGTQTGGWMLDHRLVDGRLRYDLYVRNGQGAQTVLVNTSFTSVDLTDTLGQWHHVALSYAHDESLGVWRLYHNGTPAGTATNAAAATTQNHGNFYMGGRASNYMDGFLDFWRVSDTVLTPEDFLSYPAVIPPVPATPKTLAYWRLDRHSGTNDLKSFVNAAYRMRIYGAAPLASGESFAALLPNSDKSDGFVGNARTNIGSVCYDSSAAGRYLSAADLGLKVDLTNSFTAEGWVKRTTNPGGTFYYVAGARDGLTGWMLTLRNDNSAIRYHLHVNRGAGTNLDSYFPVGHVTSDMEWQHVALTYDCTLAGLGVWELFINGTSSGTLTNTGLPTASHGINAFNLCGRVSGSNTFIGYYDCWRVTDSVLAPGQFLNAAVDQPPVPRTLGYWKLDAPGGVMDLASSVDARFGLIPANGGPAATNIQVRLRIPNPDTSPDFIGDPTNHTGSVFFRGPAEAANERSAYASYLGLQLDPADSFTVEGWLRLYGDPADTNSLFFVAGNRRSAYGWMLTLRRDAADEKTLFHLYTQTQDGMSVDSFFPSADMTGKREWTHVALVHDRVAADLGTWELFLDGVPQGILTNTVFARTRYPNFDFQLGGRVSGGIGKDATPACFDSWRVVDQPLTADQLLNHGFPRGTLIRIK